MPPPATSIALPSFSGNQMLTRQPGRWLCSKDYEALYHIFTTSCTEFLSIKEDQGIGEHDGQAK